MHNALTAVVRSLSKLEEELGCVTCAKPERQMNIAFCSEAAGAEIQAGDTQRNSSIITERFLRSKDHQHLLLYLSSSDPRQSHNVTAQMEASVPRYSTICFPVVLHFDLECVESLI